MASLSLSPRLHGLPALAVAVAAGLGDARPMRGQSAAPPPMSVFAGDLGEQYRRVMQLAGALPQHQWTVRGFGPKELDVLTRSDSAHPWRDRIEPRVRQNGSLRWTVIPVGTQTVYNSRFPYGYNDGPIWAGKGLTQAISGGLSMRRGPVSATIVPMAFWAQNAAFPLDPNGRTGRAVYVQAFYKGAIDMPQRFGDGSYRRIDPGQSTLRVDAGPAVIGISTANEVWGPGVESPIILGTNAPGFPRLFVGTSRPADVYVGTVHGRVQYGVLTQSGYAIENLGKRYSASVVGTFSPRGAPQLELGGARFFHVVSPSGKIPAYYFPRPFEGFLKQKLRETSVGDKDDPYDNQLASIFGRLSFPGVGVEAFAEYAREDHNANLTDLIGQPDHDAASLFGIQRVWKSAARDRYTVLRVEVLNSRMGHLGQFTEQTIFYTHDVNGHTNLGQILGTPGGVGGGSAAIVVTRYTSSGSRALKLGRVMRSEVLDETGLASRRADVMQEISVEQLRFGQGGRPNVSVGLTSVIELNRSRTSSTLFNLNMVVRLTAPAGERPTRK